MSWLNNEYAKLVKGKTGLTTIRDQSSVDDVKAYGTDLVSLIDEMFKKLNELENKHQETVTSSGEENAKLKQQLTESQEKTSNLLAEFIKVGDKIKNGQ